MTGPDAPNTDASALAASFDSEAKLYDLVRPSYEDSVLDVIAEHGYPSSSARLLEIGCGSGIATRQLAQRGYDITAVEPGASLANIARESLRQYPTVRVITASFEDVELPEESFDVAVAAMSLHWVNENTRFRKPHQLLKSGGSLAILYTWPIADETIDPFYEDLGKVAEQYGFTEASFRPVNPNKLGVRPTVDETFFETPDFYSQRQKTTFAPSGIVYAGYLASLSAVLTLDNGPRQQFISDVASLVDNQYGGNLEVPFASTIAIAKKRII